MPPKRTVASAPASVPPLAPIARMACVDDSADLPALTRLPTVTNETSALLRGPSFMQSIDQHRRSKRQTAAAAASGATTSSARSTAASSVASVPARLSLVPGIQGGPTTTAVASSSSSSSGLPPSGTAAASSPVCGPVHLLRREPTMLHSGDRLVPSMSPERVDAAAASATEAPLVSTEDDGLITSASSGMEVPADTDVTMVVAAAATTTVTQTTTTVALPPQRRYTVVLDLDETVVYGRDGELVARAHLKNFIRSVGTATELIVWTAGERSYAKQVVREINEDGVIRHCIYRDKVWFDAKDYTKNLARLGRDPQHVLVVENTPECVRENPQNGIIVSDFEGGKGEADRTLLLLSHLVLDMVKAQRPVPEYLAASKALKRQLVPSGDGARRIPIFFLSARAKVPGLEPAAARASDASVSMSVGSLVLDDDGEVTLAQVVAEAEAVFGETTSATAAAAASTQQQRSEDTKVVKVNRDAAPKPQQQAAAATAKKAAPAAAAAAGKRPAGGASGAVASALLLASKGRTAPAKPAVTTSTTTAAGAARARAATAAAAATGSATATSTTRQKTAAAVATAKAEKKPTAAAASAAVTKKVSPASPAAKPAPKAAPPKPASRAAKTDAPTAATAPASSAGAKKAPPPKPAAKAVSTPAAADASAGARRGRS